MTMRDKELGALTENERSVLDVLLDPEMASKTITERIEKSGVSRNGWYKIIARPHFKELIRDMMREVIMQDALPMLHSAVKEAKKGSFTHFKLLMEMGEMHTDKQKIEQSGSVEYVVTFSTSEVGELPKPDRNTIEAEWTEGPNDEE